MKHFFSVERYLSWMLPFTFVFLALGTGWLGWYVQRNITGQFEVDARRALNSVAELKAREIGLWRAERLATARLFQNNPDFGYEVYRFFTEPDNPWPQTHLERWLGVYIDDSQFQRLLIFDSTGRQRLALPSATGHTHWPVPVQEVWDPLSREITFLDLHYDQYDGEGYAEAHLSLIVPLTYPTDQDLIGLLVMQITPTNQLYPLLNESSYMAGISHTLLLYRQEDAFLVLNNPYSQAQTALELRLPLTGDLCTATTQAAMPALAAQGITPPSAFKTALSPVADSPWLLGICADRDILAADVDARIRYLWMTIAAAILTLAVMLTFVWYRYRNDWYRRQYLNSQAVQAAQAQAQAEADRLRNLARQIPGVIYQFAYHPDGRSAFPYASEGIRTIYEVTPEEVREDAAKIYERLHPEDHPRVIEGILASYESGEAWHDTYRVILPERGVRWLEGNATPEKLPDGSAIWHGFIMDVTERMQAEEALWEVNQRYQSLFNQSHDAVFIVDLRGYHLACNQRALDMLGYSYEEMPGLSARDLSTDKDGSQQVIQRLLAGEHVPTYERGFYHKDGSIIPVELNVELARNQQGEPIHIQSVVRDITERKRIEEALRQSQLYLTTILQTTADGFWIVDSQQYITNANQAYCRMSGYSQEELARMKVYEMDALEQPEDTAQRIQRIMANGYEIFETKHQRKDGRIFDVEVAVAFLDMQGGQLICFCRDITERKRSEEELQQSHEELTTALENLQALQEQLVQQERLAAVGQLAAGIAHDFNNILAVILLYAQMLTRSPHLSEREQEVINTIVSQTRSAAQLVDQILDFSRRSMLERKPLNWLPMLKEQIKMLERALPEGIAVSLHGQMDQSYMVHADATRLQQMVLNLAINGRDAMPNGGELRFHLAHINITEPEEELDPGNWIRLQVQDTGTGIPEGVQPYIFEPFFTTKEPGKGSGLGLAQAQGIVLQHDGQMTFTSTEGRGTTFTIYLPAIATTAPGVEERAPAQNGDQQHLLVVEDNQAVREALLDALESLNYRVTPVESGEQALDYLKGHAAEINLILSDMVMPGMSGGQLFRAVQARGWSMPLIILTGHQIHEEIESLQQEGLHGWLTKPVQIEQLAELLTKILRTTKPEKVTA
jgi:PAS domain S-box-containing protein